MLHCGILLHLVHEKQLDNLVAFTKTVTTGCDAALRFSSQNTDASVNHLISYQILAYTTLKNYLDVLFTQDKYEKHVIVTLTILSKQDAGVTVFNSHFKFP